MKKKLWEGKTSGRWLFWRRKLWVVNRRSWSSRGTFHPSSSRKPSALITRRRGRSRDFHCSPLLDNLAFTYYYPHIPTFPHSQTSLQVDPIANFSIDKRSSILLSVRTVLSVVRPVEASTLRIASQSLSTTNITISLPAIYASIYSPKVRWSLACVRADYYSHLHRYPVDVKKDHHFHPSIPFSASGDSCSASMYISLRVPCYLPSVLIDDTVAMARFFVCTWTPGNWDFKPGLLSR
jgi:hypothetical protein